MTEPAAKSANDKFIYVLATRAAPAASKIGLTPDINAVPQNEGTMVWIGAPSGGADDIVRDAGATLERYRTGSDWLAITADAAVAAISAAAFRCNRTILQLTIDQAEQVEKIATAKPKRQSLTYTQFMCRCCLVSFIVVIVLYKAAGF
jgi:hypothetical protein